MRAEHHESQSRVARRVALVFASHVIAASSRSSAESRICSEDTALCDNIVSQNLIETFCCRVEKSLPKN
jgi:hypothetical protein